MTDPQRPVLVLSTGFRAGPWARRSLAAAGFRGRGDGEPAWRVLGRVAHRGMSRDGMVDPSPADPFWGGTLAARLALDRAREVGRAARDPAPPASMPSIVSGVRALLRRPA